MCQDQILLSLVSLKIVSYISNKFLQLKYVVRLFCGFLFTRLNGFLIFTCIIPHKLFNPALKMAMQIPFD